MSDWPGIEVGIAQWQEPALILVRKDAWVTLGDEAQSAALQIERQLQRIQELHEEKNEAIERANSLVAENGKLKASAADLARRLEWATDQATKAQIQVVDAAVEIERLREVIAELGGKDLEHRDQIRQIDGMNSRLEKHNQELMRQVADLQSLKTPIRTSFEARPNDVAQADEVVRPHYRVIGTLRLETVVECSVCGALVVEDSAHDRWHRC